MVAFCNLVITSCLLVGCNGGAALQLLRFDPETKGYQLNETALHAIEVLPEPIYVLAAVGDARIGKSTFLNMLHLNWEPTDTPIDTVLPFEANSGREACTRGVWILVRRLPGYGSVVFVDVEGADLGNDAVTKQLSAFTAIMSSYILLFVKEMVNNAGLQFLYHISKLGKMFPDSDNFPYLGVTIRDPLDLGAMFFNRQSEVLHDITSPTHRDGNDNMREEIAAVFPPNKITAFDLGYQQRKQLEQLQYLKAGPYYSSVMKVISNLKQAIQMKRSPSGSILDGVGLVQIIRKLFVALESEDITVLETAFERLEKQLCDEYYTTWIQPLANMSEDKFLDTSQHNLDEYVSRCKIVSFVERVKQDVESRKKGILQHREEREKRELADKERQKAEDEATKAKEELEEAEDINRSLKEALKETEITLAKSVEETRDLIHHAELQRVIEEERRKNAEEMQKMLQTTADKAEEELRLERQQRSDLQRELWEQKSKSSKDDGASITFWRIIDTFIHTVFPLPPTPITN